MEKNSEPVDYQEQIDQARQSELAARNQVHDTEFVPPVLEAVDYIAVSETWEQMQEKNKHLINAYEKKRNPSHDKEYPHFKNEKRLRELYQSQKETLDIFLKNGAISQGQYEKSLGDLTRKMGMYCEISETPED